MSEPGAPPARATLLGAPRLLWTVAFGVAAYGCATQQGLKRLADGSYRVDCERPLLGCLEPAAKACEETGYDVLYASEVRDRYDPSPWQLGVVKSSATVRCRKAESGFSLFHGAEPVRSASPAPPAAPLRSVAPAATPLPPPPGCVPGTSQACTAVSGCNGAQVCAADGRSFRPCECAPAPPAPAPAPAAGIP